MQNKTSNYYAQLQSFISNVEHVEQVVGDLQRLLLNIKDIAPRQKTHDINTATTSLSMALKHLGICRDKIMSKALRVNESIHESETKKSVFAVPVHTIFIRQTEVAPVERFEVRQKPTDESVTMVARYPATGSWKCYECPNHCVHVEAVQEWVSSGRPMKEIDKLASPDGYENPRWSSSSGGPVGLDSPVDR
jgi:hypothetical protein